MLADLAAGDAVLDPELADTFVVTGERELTVRQRVREAGWVEVEPMPVGSGPVQPGAKVFGL